MPQDLPKPKKSLKQLEKENLDKIDSWLSKLFIFKHILITFNNINKYALKYKKNIVYY